MKLKPTYTSESPQSNRGTTVFQCSTTHLAALSLLRVVAGKERLYVLVKAYCDTIESMVSARTDVVLINSRVRREWSIVALSCAICFT